MTFSNRRPRPDTRAGLERVHRAVRGERADDSPLREDDDLVYASGKRRDLCHGGAKDRVVRVNALGDEDQSHAQKKSVSPSETAHSLPRASSGWESPCPM